MTGITKYSLQIEQLNVFSSASLVLYMSGHASGLDISQYEKYLDLIDLSEILIHGVINCD